MWWSFSGVVFDTELLSLKTSTTATEHLLPVTGANAVRYMMRNVHE